MKHTITRICSRSNKKITNQRSKYSIVNSLPATDPVDKASRDHVVQEEEVAIPVLGVFGHFEEALVLVYHAADLGSVLLHSCVPVGGEKGVFLTMKKC